MLPDDERVTVNDLIVKACAVALGRHPKFTARFTEDGLAYPGEGINIDIGIALDEGLIAPSLLDCGNKTVAAIARDSKGLIERAREGKLRADEYGQGAFTITNLGAYGVESLIGIINPPQAAILGVGSAMQKPVVEDGAGRRPDGDEARAERRPPRDRRRRGRPLHQGDPGHPRGAGAAGALA